MSEVLALSTAIGLAVVLLPEIVNHLAEKAAAIREINEKPDGNHRS